MVFTLLMLKRGVCLAAKKRRVTKEAVKQGMSDLLLSFAGVQPSNEHSKNVQAWCMMKSGRTKDAVRGGLMDFLTDGKDLSFLVDVVENMARKDRKKYIHTVRRLMRVMVAEHLVALAMGFN